MEHAGSCKTEEAWSAPELDDDALAYHYKEFHPKSDAICSAQPFEAPEHHGGELHPEGSAFPDNVLPVKATEHHYKKAGDVFTCDYANCQRPGPFKRLTRLRDHLRGDIFDAILALEKPRSARKENDVMAASVRKLTSANRTQALG
ncbi:hypothetical protein Purlil1_13737 [Purpureocillium lilacinum]|uniref:Uncharacterized protein n=1 Tax=Purpureocillium lilacinum TaxID=33203 RepID=A0ABR0BDC3_PURLI|nr:hypothetical protein Purlil1_13737 [Purpureocillium lilacinum]